MTNRVRPWCGLFVGIAAVLLIWLGVLPRIAELDGVARQMQFLDSRGIDPSARFYTDQPAAWHNIRIVRDKTKHSPEAFWGGPRSSAHSP